jgi:hypothetical protein
MPEEAVLQALKIELTMSTNAIFALQSVLTALQLLNAGLAAMHSVSPIVPLAIGSLVGGLQMFIQKAGNEAQPPVKRSKRHSAEA